VTKRDDATLKALFASGTLPTGQSFADLIESMLDIATPRALTIVSGMITRTQFMHRLDTEDQAASDTLTTVNGGSDGQLLLLMLTSASRTVTVEAAGLGNLDIDTNYSMNSLKKYLLLVYHSTEAKWHQLLRT
jgi:hypothetical protein